MTFIMEDVAVIKNIQKMDSLLKNHKLSAIYLSKGIVETYRTEDLQLIWGQEKREVTVVENGMRLLVPLGKCYFNPRFSNERKAFSHFAKDYRTVLDASGGLGGFTTMCLKENPLLEITYNDLNPIAKEYAMRNFIKNKVRPLEVICKDIVDLKGEYEVIVHNCPSLIEDHFEKLKMLLSEKGVVWFYFFSNRREGYFRGIQGKEVVQISSSRKLFRGIYFS